MRTQCFTSFLPSVRYLPRIPFKDLYPSLFTLNMHLYSAKESGRKNHLKRESEVTANIPITRMQFIQIQFLADLKQVQRMCKTRLLWELILTFHAASSPAPAYLYSSVATSIPAKSLTHRELSWAGIYVAESKHRLQDTELNVTVTQCHICTTQ